MIVGFEFKPLLAAAENYGSTLSETIFDDAGGGVTKLFLSLFCATGISIYSDPF